MAFTAGGRFNFITAKGATSVQEEHFHSVYFAAGTASASGQQDVGHEGVATGRREFSLPSLSQFARCGVFGHVLFPRRTGRSSVERWSQDVTDFSRPGVAALRYSHSG